jgi:hypothetical protein
MAGYSTQQEKQDFRWPAMAKTMVFGISNQAVTRISVIFPLFSIFNSMIIR